MLEAELIRLVRTITTQKCEKQHLELKKALSGTPERLYGTMSSFANQIGGGTIIFGIDEEHGYEITGVHDAQTLQKHVTEQALQMEPAVRPLFTVAEIEGKLVVSAEIAECEIHQKPCYYRGVGRVRGSYIRVGESDLQMSEYEIYSYEAFKKRIHDELRTVPRATEVHLNRDMIARYMMQLRQLKTNLVNLDDRRMLETQGILQDGVPSMAGLLLFGEYPQEFFPQLSVIAVVVQGSRMGELGEDGARFVDNKRIEGTISQMLEGTLSFVRRNMKTKTIITEDGSRTDKTEYPIKAVREIILNALIHRDYSVHTERSPIRLVMFEDRLELENPGGLYGRMTIDDLGKTSGDTRNPYLAGALEIMLETENRFSGIPTIRVELSKAGLPAPVFTDNRGVFKVVFHNEAKIEDKNARIHAEILRYCQTPRTREELAQHFGFSSQSYFVKRYITPLVALGKLHMRFPGKPRSKRQQYYS
jgi:ATP-dependent DNA helicase RecG